MRQIDRDFKDLKEMTAKWLRLEKLRLAGDEHPAESDKLHTNVFWAIDILINKIKQIEDKLKPTHKHPFYIDTMKGLDEQMKKDKNI